ncbi:3-phosphoserine/phosphohydroxythreonine transaminase [Desertivirga arenae]|uniref:3-phosphoserine/phosphohydroxythreonine transaminase n=1 Tax=Desertivirga arenae TaxID=2810309 RepID=UPI001F6024A6|nr:3-phosphoserine/phosphohydroxythreonine transaminase [Pedobacter sp. SYSU D00823]
MENILKHNFSAGPSILPPEVLEGARHAIGNWQDQGLSILEVSHRTPEFRKVVDEVEELLRELMNIPSGYSILFIQGGASTQFSMIPFNFMGRTGKAAYLDAGFFSKRAIVEASHFGLVDVVASSADSNYTFIPSDYKVDPSCSYFHCTSNNTIEGSQMHSFPSSPVPLICDMSSDILSRTIDISQFDLIYAGAQKNMGPAGVTVVIVKDDLLNNINNKVPAMWDYRIFRECHSLYNTPPVFSLYVMLLNLRWIKKQGGVKEMESRNKIKADILYKEIDSNPLFQNAIVKEDRSLMNVSFSINKSELENAFYEFAQKEGMVGLRAPFGNSFRASLYNALPISSVQALVNTMKEFTISMDFQTSLNTCYL